MRPSHLALLLACALPGAAAAKAWQGIVPGQSTRADVVARFGEPSTHGRLGDRTALVYKADQAIAGTRQAQFFTREDGLVLEIVLWPSSALDRESVEGTYGKGAKKTFTEDFRPVWLYKSQGISVFFAKDGTVDAISFRPADGTPAPAPRESAPPKPAARPGGSS
ncbi:MAG TPA: hypothetical protein VLD85_12140 [Anaeromyxobacteraceae bacterium]|nr:hypothetical protein [Anaeromyxobacteraceae bacterium]